MRLDGAWVALVAAGLSAGVATPTAGQIIKGDRVRNILREQTDAGGRVQAEVAAEGGWQSARGFRWQILLEGPDGRYRPARADRTFRTGERFRLEIEADSDLWLYVLNRGPDGSEVVLLPVEAEEHLRIGRGERAVVPPTGQFRFQDPPGTETFRLIAAARKFDWVNPTELFRLESGAELDKAARERAEFQKETRTRELAAMRERQPAVRVLERPIDLRSPALREGVEPGRKDVVLVAPTAEQPEAGAEGGEEQEPPSRQQQVSRLSTDAEDEGAIVFDIELRHEGR
jgi:hypothetical protein